ncbi:serine protease [Thiohalocapsa marina]|uniref:Serine protease n=1 Tax=Thiohalocapsa marina TaxID=424902 RepID=A0A5M8FKH1_9GAMM|nr:serine protease [Thiohalocapsa marina]KAA6184480.1 serine protease [Thiohalocapsa marina]
MKIRMLQIAPFAFIAAATFSGGSSEVYAQTGVHFGLADNLIKSQDNQRIVGGQDASIEDYPWQVALMSGNFQFCGGSILSERWVLTAAHCENSSLTHIRAGVTNKTDSATGQDIAVLRQIPHPNYGQLNELDSDMMLLELAAPIDLSGSKAMPVPIMTQELAGAGLQDPGVSAKISGWGALSEGGSSSDILQEATVPVVSNAEAAEEYGAGSITPNMIAAGYPGIGGTDTCQGDSGGPMVVEDPDPTNLKGYRLAGVTSFGIGCARPDFVGIYARVSQFENWVLGKLSTGECLLNWAERSYPSMFAPAGRETQFSDPYDFRFYAHTNSYLGVSRVDNHVYYLDSNGFYDVGLMSDWLPQAGCEPKPTECLFDWAEQQFSEMFPPLGGIDVVSYTYSYRYYPMIGTYLGLNSADNQIRYIAADGIERGAGSYDYWMEQSGCNAPLMETAAEKREN